MSYQAVATSDPAPSAPAESIVHAHVRQPDMLTSYGGNLFWFVDVVIKKLSVLLAEATDDDCTIILCGFIFQPCLIAQALEEVEENWWFTCCSVLLAPQLLGLPYLCFTVPAMNRLNVKLGGEPNFLRHLILLCACRPCVAIQLARAVKQAKADGRLGPSRAPVQGAPSAEIMERL